MFSVRQMYKNGTRKRITKTQSVTQRVTQRVTDHENGSRMDLAQAGIALKCRCGASMAAGMDDIQFGDKGRVRISCQDIRCSICGAIYREGERLKYRLVRIEGKF